MPYELYGADISQPAGSAALADVYAHLCEKDFEVPDDLALRDEQFDKWINETPEEVKDLLTLLSDHESPETRLLAGRRAKQLLKIDPEFTQNMIEKLLQDGDPVVRKETASYYDDVLGEEIEDYLTGLGLFGLQKIVRAYRYQSSQQN